MSTTEHPCEYYGRRSEDEYRRIVRDLRDRAAAAAATNSLALVSSAASTRGGRRERDRGDRTPSTPSSPAAGPLVAKGEQVRSHLTEAHSHFGPFPLRPIPTQAHSHLGPFPLVANGEQVRRVIRIGPFWCGCRPRRFRMPSFAFRAEWHRPVPARLRGRGGGCSGKA